MSDTATLTRPAEAIHTVDVGVVGVGSMGQNHARVYRHLPGANLVGVADADEQRAASVASRHETDPVPADELLRSVDAVSIAVPTAHHYEVARRCLDHNVDVLVEKPFVRDLEQGRELESLARRKGLVIQIGHIERFNPAIRALVDVIDGLDVIAASAHRLGPPVEREIDDGVIMDLMVHDLDVVLSLLDAWPTSIDAAGNRDGQYATAQLTFPDDTICTFTASRVTQRRIRQLDITAAECQVAVDYLDQSVHIHRRSQPEYTRDDGSLRYRNESVVERPMVERREPLRAELESFLESVRTRTPPVVTAADGIRTVELAERIERRARRHHAAEGARP